jgi:hypothetical protein
MMDDLYSYPYAEHPSYSPPPDYSSPMAGDWSSATPEAPVHPLGWRPFGAHLVGDTAYAFLTSFVAWLRAVRSPGA